MDAKPIVFILDDDADYLESMSALVMSMGFDIESFLTVDDFLKRFLFRRPSCVLLDIHMPNIGGLKLQEYFAKNSVHIPIIIVSGSTEPSNAVRALQQGAIAYLQKPTYSESELWESLQLAMAIDSNQKSLQLQKDSVSARLAKLTEAEREVLQLLLAGKQYNDIATTLKISRRTVENRRSKLMRKLELSTLPQLIQYAHDAGILPPG